MKKYILPILLCLSGSIEVCLAGIIGGQKRYTYEVTRNQPFTIKFPAIQDYERREAYIEYKTEQGIQKEENLPANRTFSRTYHIQRGGGTITFHRPGQPNIVYDLDIAPELKRKK